ncbi:hypothetical protein [Micromonospora sp. RTP1Z1]|uniref:hypothetical protein n=1 Tax=Micromonospora sp. RTP1Z1 TaxID=2994043 RepID=UPI0029C94E0F|nr:hypothetical protein [Micromonospora sp. RTP1Z1]
MVSEGVEQFEMVALDVPPRADMHAVKALVTAGEADGHWTFEEGCIGDAWAAIKARPGRVQRPGAGNPAARPAGYGR